MKKDFYEIRSRWCLSRRHRDGKGKEDEEEDEDATPAPACCAPRLRGVMSVLDWH